MDELDYDYNFTDDYNFTFVEYPDTLTPQIQPMQIVSLICYGLVFLLGVPGNGIVVWVTGFRMARSVTSMWFLNLALADLLCCLSLPLLMIPLAHDDHWHFGPVGCTLLKGLFFLVMYSSVLQLVFISVDRCLLVTKPVWCQNHRRPRQAVLVCVGVWVLALLGSIPQFVYAKEITAGDKKRECVSLYTLHSAWLITSFRFVLGFLLPFVIIVACHIVVYNRAQSGLSSGARGTRGSKRTFRIIVAVVLSFFLCWLPLHIVDFLSLATPRRSHHSPRLYLAQGLAVCLAYFNSCLNPLLYVCLGRGFKDSMNRSMRSLFNFITEEPPTRISVTNNDTKSTSTSGKETSRI